MLKGNARAEDSLFFSQIANPYHALVSSIRSRHVVPALTAFAVVLGDFLPLLLANVPFSRGSTFFAHNICTWAAVAVLGYMLITMALLLATVFRPGVYAALPFDVSSLGTVAVPAVLASGSPELLSLLEGSSLATPEERRKALKGPRYGLVVSSDGDSTRRCGIEVSK